MSARLYAVAFAIAIGIGAQVHIAVAHVTTPMVHRLYADPAPGALPDPSADIGGYLFTMALSVIGYAAHSLYAGLPVGRAIIAGITTSLAASGMFHGAKHVARAMNGNGGGGAPAAPKAA